MGVKRTKIRPYYKDASYSMFGSGGSGGSSGFIGIGGSGGSGINIQLAMQKEERKKKIENELKTYRKQQSEKIQKQNAELKQLQSQRNMIDPKILNTHTKDISSPKLRNIFKEMDEKRVWDEINAETKKYNEPKEHFVITFIKNINKKKPPKNMTIVQ